MGTMYFLAAIGGAFCVLDAPSVACTQLPNRGGGIRRAVILRCLPLRPPSAVDSLIRRWVEIRGLAKPVPPLAAGWPVAVVPRTRRRAAGVTRGIVNRLQSPRHGTMGTWAAPGVQSND
jgi:hypothetical protein